MMDDPRHARIRRLVSIGLTPRAVADLEPDLRARTRAVLDEIDSDHCDFVGVASEMPLQAISMLMGVPEDDRHLLARCVDHAFDFKDRDYYEETDAVAADKVVFWEASANREASVFRDAAAFDVARDPNPHVGFGHGVHFCLGANLARLELRIVLEEMLDRFESLELTAEPEWTRSNKHTGLRHLPLRFHLDPDRLPTRSPT